MKAEPCTYVIFGATGNLSRIKLMPSLYRLDAANRLPEGTRILAIGRRPWDQATWLAEVRRMIQDKAPGDFDETVFQPGRVRIAYLLGILMVKRPGNGTRCVPYSKHGAISCNHPTQSRRSVRLFMPDRAATFFLINIWEGTQNKEDVWVRNFVLKS